MVASAPFLNLLSLGLYPFLRQWKRKPPDASNNDPTLGIYML